MPAEGAGWDDGVAFEFAHRVDGEFESFAHRELVELEKVDRALAHDARVGQAD